VTDGTIPLKALRDAVVTIVSKRDAGITPHTVSIIDTETNSRTTNIAEWTMIDNFILFIIV
jgi:hypothetical protein